MKVSKDDRLECLYVSEDYRIWFRPCIWEDGTLRWYAIHKTSEHNFILGYGKSIVELAENLGFEIDFSL